MNIKEKVELYKALKSLKKTLDKKIQDLREEILKELPVGQVESGLVVKERDATNYDEDRVWEVMEDKKVSWQYFCNLTPDPDMIEALYLEGRITDDNLRYIRAPKFILALEEVKEVEDVQEINEGSSSRL